MRRLLALALALALVLTAAAGAAPLTVAAAPSSAAETVSVRRLAGADRYATAVAVARATLRTTTGPGTNDVVVARGDAFPDALSGVNLTGSSAGGGPGAVLLTPFGGLTGEALALLRELRPHDADVLGSPDVVSARVYAQVTENSLRPDRLGQSDRYGTNSRTYTRAYTFEGELPAPVDGLRTALLVSGQSYADAVAAGPVAHRERVPLLLTESGRLSPATRTALQHAEQIEQVVVVGGPSAVSERVVREVRALGMPVRRVAGATRQETAVRVFEFAAQEFGWQARRVVLARGDGFADALAGGPYAGRQEAPLLLTGDATTLSAPTRDFLRAHAATITAIDVLGDETAVSEAVVRSAREAATTAP